MEPREDSSALLGPELRALAAKCRSRARDGEGDPDDQRRVIALTFGVVADELDALMERVR